MARHETTREPRQERSQKRVAQILDAARAIIESKGAATMKMSEIAEVAGVSSGSIYQYFSNKSDIIAALVASILNEKNQLYRDFFAERPISLVHLSHVMMSMLECYFKLHMHDPVVRDIWAGYRADKKLQDVDDDDDVANRDLIFEASSHLFREEEHERVKTNLLLLIKFGGAAVVMASQYEGDKARQVFEEAKVMLYVTLETALFPLGTKAGDRMPMHGPNAAATTH